MKELIVLLTHVWGNQLDELYSDLSSCKDTIILADKNSKYINDYPKDNPNLILFNGNSIEHGLYHHKIDDHIFFNDFMPLFQIMDILQKYDRFWLIESDVRYNGNWEDFFKKIDSEEADLMVAWYNSYHNAPHFWWWPNKNTSQYYQSPYPPTKTLLDIPQNRWRKGLFCISRISTHLMKLIYQEMPFYHEYFECLIPTLAYSNGFTIKNLSKRDVLSKEYSWTKKNGYVEDNKIHHACKIINSEIPSDILDLYNTINEKTGFLKILVKKQYKDFLNKLWIKTHELSMEIDNDLIIELNNIKNYDAGSEYFCDSTRYLIQIDKKIKQLPQQYFDGFLTKNKVEKVGIYLNFLTYYLNRFGKNDLIISVCENLLQDQIYPLHISEKTYIKHELEQLKKYNICPRLVNRILSQIYGYPEPKILYETPNGDEGQLIKKIGGSINYKYYPF